VDIRRQQLEVHITTSLQQHVMLLMIDRTQLKTELNEIKAKLSKTETKLHEAESRLVFSETFSNPANRLKKCGDSIKITMLRFCEYRRSGKVWHSPPFYYREGYKMCLAVHANGVGEGAGTHVCVTLMLLKGEHDSAEHDSAQHRSEPRKCDGLRIMRRSPFGQQWFNVCRYQPLSQYSEGVKELSHDEKFCTHEYIVSKLVNDCLTFNIEYYNECLLDISVN
jgi:hypothetical protein